MLEENTLPVPVSAFNREVLLALSRRKADFSGSVEALRVRELKDKLEVFLKETWADQPEAHKYVTASCLALAFVFHSPLHPQDKVGYRIEEKDGEKRYVCRFHEQGTICDYCAAIAELPERLQ